MIYILSAIWSQTMTQSLVRSLTFTSLAGRMKVIVTTIVKVCWR